MDIASIKVKTIFIAQTRKKANSNNKTRKKFVVQTYKEFMVGATMIEQILDERSISINHNRIRRILLEE